jgi:hypothetical protein
MGDGLPQPLRLLTIVERLAGQEPRRCRDSLGDHARLEELPLLFLAEPPGGVVRRRRGEVHRQAHDGRQVVADLRERPVADHRMAVEQSVDVGHDLVEVREVERPSSRCHRCPRRPEGIVSLFSLRSPF